VLSLQIYSTRQKKNSNVLDITEVGSSSTLQILDSTPHGSELQAGVKKSPHLSYSKSTDLTSDPLGYWSLTQAIVSPCKGEAGRFSEPM
jgi:hypothetical protein